MSAARTEEDIVLEKHVLHLLENASGAADLAIVDSWLNGGKRIQSSLLVTPIKEPSGSSRTSLQSMKSTRLKELAFIISLSSLLNIDELAAEKLLTEYCQEQVQVLGIKEQAKTIDLEALTTLESVRDFYYNQQQYLWKILQELLRIDEDEDHHFRLIARNNIQFLIKNDLLSILLSRITRLQDWQPMNLAKSQFKCFLGTDAPFALLDNRCSDFIGRHMLASAEFSGNELERALETLILLLYTHASLNQPQLVSLMTNASRDAYSVPRGCVQLVQAILGLDDTFTVPFSVYDKKGLPGVQAVFKKLGDVLMLKYVIVFSESLQFWRALQPTGDERQSHPLLVNYVQNDMERFTDTLRRKFETKPEKGKNNVKIHAVMYLLWGVFLEVFGGCRRTATVHRPGDFALWVGTNQSDQSDRYEDDRYAGEGDETSPVGSTAEIVLSSAVSGGAVEALVSVLNRVVGLSTNSGISGGLGAILGMHPSSVVGGGGGGGGGMEEKNEGEGDLRLVCTVLQEVVNVIISTICLAHGVIDQMLNMTLLVEMTHRGDDDLCETFWNEWQNRRKQRERGDTRKSPYPLCQLLESLLENTPHDSTYVFAILTSLASTSARCFDILEILNEQVSMVRWTPVSDLLFLEEEGYSEDSQWVDIFTWKEGKSSFHGAKVMYSASTTTSARSIEHNHSHSVLRDIATPQQGSLGIVCDVATDGKEELLVRWEDQVLWWGVVMDTVSHAPQAASSIVDSTGSTALYGPSGSYITSGLSGPELRYNSSSNTAASSSSEVIKTSAALELLSTLMTKQRLLTGFYLENKWEQLFLYSVLTDIGGVHLFTALSQANENVSRIISDPQRAYSSMISDDIGIPPGEAVKLITLLQEYARDRGSTAFQTIHSSQYSQTNSNSSYQSTSSSSLHTSSVCFMLSDYIVSVVATLSKIIGNQSKSAENTVLEAFFISALRFLSSFASSSASWAVAVNKSLSEKLELVGPRSLPEVLYRVANMVDGVSGRERCSNMASELCTVLHAVLQSMYDYNITPTAATQQMLLSMVTYLVTLFIDFQQIPMGSGDSCPPFHGWRVNLTQKCLSVFHLILSHTSPAAVISLQEGGILELIGESLMSRLTDDPRLLRAVLRVCTEMSSVAVLDTPVSGSTIVTAKRVFQATPKRVRNSDSVLPIDFSYALQSLTPLEISVYLSLTSSAVDILSLIFDLQNKHQPEVLCVTLSVLGGRIELPAGTAGTAELRGCTYMTLLCGLLQSLDSLSGGASGVQKLRLGAFRVITDMILLMSVRTSRTSKPSEAFSLVDCLGVSGVKALCVSLCDTMVLTGSNDDKQVAVTAFDLLLSIGREQPATLLSLFNVKQESEEDGVNPSETKEETKVGMLLLTISSLLRQAKAMYSLHPMLLHKIYEFIGLLWTNAASLRPLTLIAIHMIQMDPKFFSLIAVPLTHKLSEPPLLSPSAPIVSTSAAAQQSIIPHAGSVRTGSPSVRDIFQAATAGSDVSQLLLESKRTLRSLEKQSNEYCYTLLAHSSSLQLLALERHGHLFSMDASTARRADTEMHSFFLKATEMNNFFSWLTSYMRVDICDDISESVADEARAVGLELSSLIRQGSHITGSAVGPRTRFGDRYIYDLNIMHKKVVAVCENRCLEIDEKNSFQDISKEFNTWVALARNIHALNLQWSLSDAQMMLLQSWKVFIQIFVLPGSSARQLAFKAQYESNGRTNRPGGEGWTPPSSPAVGSLSPSFDPITGSPSGASNSNFAGDKRSYEVVDEIAKHLQITTSSGINGLESSGTIGIGSARVLLEKSELLSSMLHHQLREVLLRASDPRRSQVDSRNLGSSRLGPEKMKGLLATLTKCYTCVMTGLGDHVPPSHASLHGNVEPQKLKKSIQRQLFTAFLLILRGIVQLDVSPLFPRSRTESESSSSYLSGLERLRIFRLAVHALKEEETNGEQGEPLSAIALRLMKCCMPLNINALSLSHSQAWRVEVTDSHMPLPHILTTLLRNLSASAVREGTIPRDHDYSHWALNTVCGPEGSAVAPSPQIKKTALSSSYSTTSSSATSSSASVPSSSSFISGLFALLDMIHGGISSGVLLLSEMVGTYGLLGEFSSLGVFHELQGVLLMQAPSRCATLMGYNSTSGEVSDLTNCWERVLDSVSLILSLAAEKPDSPHSADEGKKHDQAVMREKTFEGVLTLLRSFGPLLMLPLTQSFSQDKRISRLTLRRVQLCRCSFSLFSSVTQHFRVWKAVLPELFDATLSEALRAAAVFITLLTDVKMEDKGPAHPVTEDQDAEEEKDIVSAPPESDIVTRSLMKRGPTSQLHVPRVILNHITAITDGEKEGTLMVSSYKKRRAAKSSVEEISLGTHPVAEGHGKRSGLRVTFGENMYQSAPSAALGPTLGRYGANLPGEPLRVKSDGGLKGSERGESVADLSVEFVMNIERELVSSLVSMFMLIKEADISPLGSFGSDGSGSKVCVGSKVFYYSQAYERSTHCLQLLEGMIVGINILQESDIHEGKEHFEVVLANGAREFDVSPDDVIYSTPPLMGYQRLSVSNGDNRDYFQKNRYNFSSECISKDSVRSSAVKEEIWTGKGLGISEGGLSPAVVSSQGGLLGEESCTTAHLLRILAYATCEGTHGRLSDPSVASTQSSSAASSRFNVNAPITPTSSTPTSTSSSSTSPVRGPEGDLEILSGLTSWLCLGGIAHHAHAFIPRRAGPAVEYMGGRPDMIEQLEYLKAFVTGDAGVLPPPQWLVSDSWKQYKTCVIDAAEEVIKRLRDPFIPSPATPEVEILEPKKGTKIGLRTKLHFVSTPEEL